MTRELPLTLVREDGDTRVFETSVPRDLLYLRGHFEGNPVLPAVAQLVVLALKGSARAWPELVHLRRVLRLKFRRPVGPDSTLALRLVRSAAQVEFELTLGGEPCSSGTLQFET